MSDTPSLQEIVRSVEAERQSLAFFNVTAPRDALRAVESYLDPHGLDLRRETTDRGRPTDFVVLGDGEEFLGAARLEELTRVAGPDSPLLDVEHPENIQYPDLLRQIDHSTFTAYDKRRMLVASRGVEDFAWEHAGGTLHVGFQSLSLAEPQWPLYRTLADAGTDLHLYGAGEWEPPTAAENVTLHVSDAEEVRRSWFVVADAPERCRALLSWERAPAEYVGFWTDRRPVVETILDRLDTIHDDASS